MAAFLSNVTGLMQKSAFDTMTPQKCLSWCQDSCNLLAPHTLKTHLIIIETIAAVGLLFWLFSRQKDELIEYYYNYAWICFAGVALYCGILYFTMNFS